MSKAFIISESNAGFINFRSFPSKKSMENFFAGTIPGKTTPTYSTLREIGFVQDF